MNKYYYSDYLDPLDEDEWEWYSEDEEDENSEEIDGNFRSFFKKLTLKADWLPKYFSVDEIFENAVTLQLVGGYKEESGKGGVLSKRILSFFAQNQLEFKVNQWQRSVCLSDQLDSYTFWSRAATYAYEISRSVTVTICPAKRIRCS